MNLSLSSWFLPVTSFSTRRKSVIITDMHLREFAGITDEVTVVGALHKAEIWDTKTYQKVRGTVDPDAKKAALAGMML